MRRLLLAMPSDEERARMLPALVSLGYEVTVASDTSEVRHVLQGTSPDLVLLVPRAGAATLEAFATIHAQAPGVPLLLLGEGNGTPEEATNRIGGLLADAGRVKSVSPAPNRVEGRRVPFDPFLGRSDAVRRLQKEARIALASDSPVLIEGETGTGKGVLAEWLHRHGPRSHQPFVDLNCAGISRELMESELFGHERGAFTGAVQSKPGLLEVADGGTLFLDEVGDMEPPIQAKLLKVIEEKRFRRIGENRERSVDVRIIAATHRDLLQLVREARFREDLYYRIGVLSLRIPPLRRRREDLAGLVASILRSLARDLHRPLPAISPETSRILLDRSWPGNLRELRNTLERALLAASGTIEPQHLSAAEVPVRREPVPAGGTLLEVERVHIERVLEEEQNVERAARRLGMARSTLYQKLRMFGIRRPR